MPGGALGVIYCGRSVTIRINHVGIRSELFREMALSENVKEKVTSIKETFLQRQIILAVDELDPVKGIICKIQAYALFLERYPEFIDRVILLIVIWPSSVCEDEQKELHQQILEEVNGIISNFGPEVVQIMDGANLTVEDLVSYYASADIGLFATFWDGLNICPYEFTACQNSDSPGSLIVSEFMGCSRSLSGVSTINPWRLEQVSEALFANLSLSPGQRRAHHQRRFNYVMKHKFHDWVNGFLKDLDEASCQSRNLNFVQVGWGTNVRLIGLHSGFSHLEEQDIIPSYRASSQRLLLLDYDGTLSAESNAELARPSEQVLKVLRILSEDPHNIVFILSGRERKVLDDWFAPVPNLGLAAEKGVYYKWPNSKNWLNAVTVKNFEWKKATKHLMEAYTERTDGSYIEPKESAIVWHYEAADPEYGKMQASELAKYLQKVLEGWPVVEVMRYDYNRILEVKPKGVSKGFTTLRILKQLQKQKRMPQFVFAVGDDRSDEEVFGCLIDALKAGLPKSPVEHKGDDIHLPTGQGPHRSRNLITETIPEGEYHLFTSCVGIKPSNAAFYLNDPQDVVDILTSLSVVSAKYLRRAQAQKQETEGSAT